MRNNPQITISAIAQTLNLNERGISAHISRLVKKGFLHRVGPDKGGHWEVIESASDADSKSQRN